MQYHSTRGKVSNLKFVETAMMGLASDGGLMVPHAIPDVSEKCKSWKHYTYEALAFEVMRLFISDLPESVLKNLIEKSYATFEDPLIAPVRSLANLHILELFHGPTLAFKDIALQFLGNLFDFVLEKADANLNILGATSGDTGGAAIAGIKGKKRINIFILYPKGKTSRLQERQMTTVIEDNVHNICLNGSFDDCQSLMKSVFSDLSFRDRYKLGAVNSVNWVRILAQTVYYFHAWNQLDCPKKFDVAVPTGNFGNIFAGYVAKSMGLPVRHLILATNSNDILTRYFNSGLYSREQVFYSESPAMDIQVASNFERYLFYQLDQSTSKVSQFMEEFKSTGAINLNAIWSNQDTTFLAGAASDQETLDTIKQFRQRYNYLVDPHTAVGISVAQKLHVDDIPLLCVSTAHPAKFDRAMQTALPDEIVQHPTLSKLENLPERKHSMSVDEHSIKAFIADRAIE